MDPFFANCQRVVTAAFLLGLAGAAETAASFDCKQARTPAELTICASSELAALDFQLAEAYRQALSQMRADATAVAGLKADQRAFVRFRDDYLGNPGFDLADYLKRRVDFLRSVDATPRSGFIGEWRSLWGTVRIRARASGGIDIIAWAAQPAIGSWICGDPEEAREASMDGDEEGDALLSIDGSLRYTRQGPALVVHEFLAEGATELDICGHGGSMAGVYFPVNPVPTEGETTR